MELIEIINILQQEYPNKVIVDLSEYESEEHQTYKYLFEQLSQKYAEKLNEVGMLATDQQNYEKEIAELSQKNASLAAQMESVNQSTINSLGVIKEYVNLGIVVSDIMIRPVESNQTDLHGSLRMAIYWKHKFIKMVFKDVLTRAWNMPGSFCI